MSLLFLIIFSEVVNGVLVVDVVVVLVVEVVVEDDST